MNNKTQQHTAGSWQVLNEGKKLFIAGDRYVCEVSVFGNIECAPQYKEVNENLIREAEANARLIAAAPLLLAAIKNMIEKCNITTNSHCEENENPYGDMLKVIALAEPQQQNISESYDNLMMGGDENWVIIKDVLEDEQHKCPSATVGQLAKLFEDGFTELFRMYDDDNILYYEGLALPDADFAPLDDYGMPNAGATRIEYLNTNTGKYETL